MIKLTPKGARKAAERGSVIAAPENTIGSMVGVTPSKDTKTYLKNGALSAPKKKLANPKGRASKRVIKQSGNKSSLFGFRKIFIPFCLASKLYTFVSPNFCPVKYPTLNDTVSPA